MPAETVHQVLWELGFSFRDWGRTSGGSGSAPVVAPPPSWPRPPPSRACSVGRAGPAGLRGLPQLPALAQPVGAGSFLRGWVLSPRLAPGKLRAEAGF